MRPTLGVVAIAHNEAVDLPGFLKNTKHFADEIVIVDDGSDDDTVAMARAAGAVVVVSPRGPGEYFAHQRNKGIGAAKSDWLLHMDIDERVPPALAHEIFAAIKTTDKDAYDLTRQNHFLHRPMKSGAFHWCQIHLARREILRFSGLFHEATHIAGSPERIGQLKTPIAHLNEATFAERLVKSDRYLEELVIAARKAPPFGAYGIARAFLGTFLKRYFWQRGFVDGTAGLVFALHSATAAFRAKALVWDERTRQPRTALEAELAALWDAPLPLPRRRPFPLAKPAAEGRDA